MTKRRRALLLGFFVVLLSIGFPSLVLLDQRSPTQRALDWATAHASSLPVTLDEIAAFPPDYRRAIFRKLEPSVQAALWQDQVDRILRNESLDDEQRAEVLRMRSFITPANYAAATPPAALAEMCKRGSPTATLLGDYKKLFTALGAHASPTFSARAIGIGAYESWSARATALARRGNGSQSYCDCLEDSWCGCTACYSFFCAEQDNCGCFQLYHCNGECIRP